jgi:hypothetical protein
MRKNIYFCGVEKKRIMIDNAVVQAKMEYAQQIAAASKMEYIMVPGKQAKERLEM